MCGISGFYRLRDGAEAFKPLPVLEQMNRALEHRGPDSCGTWQDAERGVGLAHRRLAIRDLSPNGHQPMVSSCGRFVIAYNGEVYSHAELATTLAAKRQLKGASDTEIILEAFAEWGVDAVLPQLIGMFAFALYDRQTGELVLVRDRLGIKPLYWGVVCGAFVFGSELKALRALPTWKPRVDRDALAAFMRHNYIPAPRTIYQGISKLEPGCVLRVASGREPKIARYWDLRSIVTKVLRSSVDLDDRTVVDQVEALACDAVSRRMVSDVPIGALLSGGIDSSLVAALMQESANRPIRTFSIGFNTKGYDEAPFAREVAKHIGSDHTELYVDPDDALTLIDKLPFWYDEPFADSSQIPTQIVCALTRKHVTVVLSGDGGDELFAGYGRYALALETWGRAESAPPTLCQVMARAALATPEGLLGAIGRLAPPRLRNAQFGKKVHKFARTICRVDPDDMYRRMLSHWNEPEAIVLGAREPKGVLWDPTVAREIPDFLDRMQFLDTVTYLPDDILTKVDRASMSVALEARVPLLDHRLVEMSWTLPQHFKMRDGESKWVLRQILYRRFPRALIDRPKMGFGVPVAEWLRGPLRDWAETLLAESRLHEQGLFDPQPIRQRWAAHLAGENWGYPLWNVLVAQAWLDANPGVAT